MPVQLVNYINEYGYLILFALVFIQEIGVPTFPNEIVLYYFGYLCSQKIFSVFIAIAVAISADFIGATLLYTTFYFLGSSILKLKIPFIKIPLHKIEKLQTKSLHSHRQTIFLSRVTPFIRGYVSVFAGLSQLSYKFYGWQVLLSASLFSGGLIVLGWATGKYFTNIFSLNIESNQLPQIVFVGIAIFVLAKWLIKKYRRV